MRQSSLPYLLLDVDGVVNRLVDEAPTNHLETSYGGWPVIVHPRTGHLVRRLLGCFEPVWATAWEDSAHRFWSPILGLPVEPWPHISFSGFPVSHGKSWKHDDIKAWVSSRGATGRGWVWMDDDIHAEDIAMARRHGGMALRTDPRVGISEEVVDRAIAFSWATQWTDVEEMG